MTVVHFSFIKCSVSTQVGRLSGGIAKVMFCAHCCPERSDDETNKINYYLASKYWSENLRFFMDSYVCPR